MLGRLLLPLLRVNDYQVSEYDGDVRSSEDVQAWLLGSPVDAIVHLAAKVPVDVVARNPMEAFAVNAIGTKNVLDAANRLADPPWTFLASTSHVYRSADGPLSEDAELGPISIYGETKLIAEEIGRYYERHTAVPVCIGRIFSFYHDTQAEPYLFPTLKRKISQLGTNESLKLKGAGSRRDMLPAEQVVKYIAKLMQRRATGTVNIGSGVGVTIREFARGVAGPSVIVEDESDAAPITSLVADVSRLQAVLGE